MNILGIDFGTKRIGLAVKRDAVDVVLPFGVFEWEGEDEKIQEFAKLILKENFDKIVIGLPVGLESGEETKNSKKVREFAEKIKLKIDTPIEFADERYSSHEADEMGGEAYRDEKAAMVILQEYLQN
ncbi:MAG: Holliday junction resolvase RuvX [Candidatus Magasanikbacteria bacterium]|nr:Holliday junction resolvase RuvX [Candidatus Magasanikbacteria bacterium]